MTDPGSWGRHEAALNPAQQSTLQRLGTPVSERPRFPTTVATRLRDDMAARLAPIAERLRGDLYLNKHRIDRSLGCEVRPDDDFEWNAPRARGAVGHKAIELSVMRRDNPPPLELVDDAIGALIAGQRGLGEWLGQQDETTLARVRAEANAHLVSFLETWPPIEAAWVPVLEGALAADIGRVRLAGRPDLTLGSAKGDVASKVIVDFKTGRVRDVHVADLRFYALIDTLKIGTPPRLLVTSYLDSGALAVEQVTEDLLAAAADRVVDAAGRIATLEAGERDPRRRPSVACRWCPVLDECEEGTAFLAAARDDGTLDDEI